MLLSERCGTSFYLVIQRSWMHIFAAPRSDLVHPITIVLSVLHLNSSINMQIFSLIYQFFLNWQLHAWWNEKLYCDTVVKLLCLNCNKGPKPGCQVRNAEEFKVIFMKEFRIKIRASWLSGDQTDTQFCHIPYKEQKREMDSGNWIQMTEILWAGINRVLFQNGWIAFLFFSSRIIRSVSQLVPGREYLESPSRRSCEKHKGYCS